MPNGCIDRRKIKILFIDHGSDTDKFWFAVRNAVQVTKKNNLTLKMFSFFSPSFLYILFFCMNKIALRKKLRCIYGN